MRQSMGKRDISWKYSCKGMSEFVFLAGWRTKERGLNTPLVQDSSVLPAVAWKVDAMQLLAVVLSVLSKLTSGMFPEGTDMFLAAPISIGARPPLDRPTRLDRTLALFCLFFDASFPEGGNLEAPAELPLECLEACFPREEPREFDSAMRLSTCASTLRSSRR